MSKTKDMQYKAYVCLENYIILALNNYFFLSTLVLNLCVSLNIVEDGLIQHKISLL